MQNGSTNEQRTLSILILLVPGLESTRQRNEMKEESVVVRTCSLHGYYQYLNIVQSPAHVVFCLVALCYFAVHFGFFLYILYGSAGVRGTTGKTGKATRSTLVTSRNRWDLTWDPST